MKIRVVLKPRTKDKTGKVENGVGAGLDDKIAIVADHQLETDLLMFAGAGFRRAPVKFFSANQLALARA